MGADSHNKYARRKTGREPVEPIHPELAEPLEDVLGETYGLIVYQEQVMAIAQKLAGYTLGQADLLRRAMGKKKKAELDKQFEAFSAGMVERGYSMDAVHTLWDILLPFSDYAFNKAHSAAYGVVSYYTAYLKANYPAEYMAALLTSVQGRQGQDGDLPQRVPTDEDPGAAAGRQRVRGQLHPGGDRHPLRARRGAQRGRTTWSRGSWRRGEQKGRYTDFNDFMDKVPGPVCNKRVVESLVKAGAFDDMKHQRARADDDPRARGRPVRRHQEERGDRPGLPVRRAGRARRHRLGGFGVSVAVPDIDDWDKMTLLGHEREMLGLYVSDHPLLGLEHVLSAAATARSAS